MAGHARRQRQAHRESCGSRARPAGRLSAPGKETVSARVATVTCRAKLSASTTNGIPPIATTFRLLHLGVAIQRRLSGTAHLEEAGRRCLRSCQGWARPRQSPRPLAGRIGLVSSEGSIDLPASPELRQAGRAALDGQIFLPGPCALRSESLASLAPLASRAQPSLTLVPRCESTYLSSEFSASVPRRLGRKEQISRANHKWGVLGGEEWTGNSRHDDTNSISDISVCLTPVPRRHPHPCLLPRLILSPTTLC